LTKLTILLLYSIPEKCEQFRVAIETQDKLPEPEVLKTKMMEEYEARKRNNIEPVHDAMFTRKNYKFPPNANTDFIFKCFNCRTIGHNAKDCKGGNQKESECNGEPKSNSAVAMQVFADEGQWCLDAGATSHMCFQKEKFENIKSESLNLKLANDATAPVVGSGKVLLEISIVTASLKETLYVPQLRIATASRKSNLHFINQCREKCNTVSTVCKDSDLQKWHEVLGHINEVDLKSMIRNEKVIGIKLNLNENMYSGEAIEKTIHEVGLKIK